MPPPPVSLLIHTHERAIATAAPRMIALHEKTTRIVVLEDLAQKRVANSAAASRVRYSAEDLQDDGSHQHCCVSACDDDNCHHQKPLGTAHTTRKIMY